MTWQTNNQFAHIYGVTAVEQSKSFDRFDTTGVRRYICEMAAELADMAADIDDGGLADRLRAVASLRIRSLEEARRLGRRSPDSGQDSRRG